MLYFSTRSKARNFAKGTKKVVDLATGSPRDMFKVKSGIQKRWAVRVVGGAV